MYDTFAITVVSMIGCALFAAFIKGRSRDKCLTSFSGDLITLDISGGKKVWGRLIVESTGLELAYKALHKNKDGYDETSYILYKNEFPTIVALIRYHDELDEKCTKDREKELRKIYHPIYFRRVRRKIANIFKTMRDSVVDLANMGLAFAKKTTPAGSLLTSQDKYVSKMKSDMIGFSGTAYEPLMERHIGSKVIFELSKDSKIYLYEGVLKNYTSEYIECLDVDYKIDENSVSKKADIVASRRCCFVRHLGESRKKNI